ncbi:DoxX family protein [Niabella yanshanensis]|uniref:DoxX family protein n=1 Tax=Niabella yanshanensis TaxID=577386 RepID=A0ABZ0W872_9BACT|nr:BT_3928 family protein [Niabella yanshanensis]WQD39483.1 DoxX family protein [Niabella yanshanensis]
MKIVVNMARIIVGILFIFSGLVKANDPIGLSYKMQEFFLVWGTGFLDGISLALSVIMIAFEIIAGAALLLGWRIKTISWLLLLLIVFFTFLTGYAYLSGKFKNCGCFGDCIPITAQTSFIKDIILLVLILLIFFNTKYIKPVFARGATTILLLLATVFSFAAQWYTLKYLPVADCLPFKKGNNIPQQMQMPANAIPDSTIITFVYEKAGKKVEFTAETFPDDFDDSTYKFVDRYDKVIRPGVNNEPPIKAFGLTAPDGKDITQDLLNTGKVVLLFVEGAETPLGKWQEGFARVVADAQQKNVPVYIVSSAATRLKPAINKTNFGAVEILSGDNTMIRTAARTNPTIYVLSKGTIEGKWSYKNFDKVSL